MDKLTGTLSGKQELSGKINAPRTVYENDYEKLANHPTLNGREIIGDMAETDPTVPDWAKAESKPEYTAKEVGALAESNEMTLAGVKDIWDSVFNKNGGE